MAQAQIEANKRFRKKSYDRIEITVPKGDREKIVQAASAAGMSVRSTGRIYRPHNQTIKRKPCP